MTLDVIVAVSRRHSSASAFENEQTPTTDISLMIFLILCCVQSLIAGGGGALSYRSGSLPFYDECCVLRRSRIM